MNIFEITSVLYGYRSRKRSKLLKLNNVNYCSNRRILCGTFETIVDSIILCLQWRPDNSHKIRKNFVQIKQDSQIIHTSKSMGKHTIL